jgi:uncharacterized membrane protein (Fun14 family)
LRTRALIFLWIIIPIIGAIGINSILGILDKYTKKRANILSMIILLLLLLFSYIQISDIAENTVKTIDHNQLKGVYKEWDSAFKWLKSNALRNSVVFTDFNWNRFDGRNTHSIDSLINLETGLRTINGNQIEATQLNTWYLNDMNFKDMEKDKEELHKFNVDYILSYRNQEYNASYLRNVYSSENIVIYKTINLSGEYEMIEYELGPNKYHFKINVFEDKEIELPVQYNNHWQANINGKPQKVKRGNSGLVELSLEKGLNDIALVFKKTFGEIVAFLISLFTIILCSLYLIYYNYKKH